MGKPPEGIVQEAISAWVEDIADEAASAQKPILESGVIPLVCVWSLASRQLADRQGSCFEFAQDFMAHDEAPGLWEDLAERVGDWRVESDEEYDFKRRIADLIDTKLEPHRFVFRAMTDGRPRAQETISPVEFSLLSALGHAAYNSTDGTQIIVLNPLGPSPINPHEFMRLAGDNVNRLAQRCMGEDQDLSNQRKDRP